MEVTIGYKAANQTLFGSELPILVGGEKGRRRGRANFEAQAPDTASPGLGPQKTT